MSWVAGSSVPGRVAAGRNCSAWSGCGSGCLDRRRDTDGPEGVVVVLAHHADPIVVFAAAGGARGGPSSIATLLRRHQ